MVWILWLPMSQTDAKEIDRNQLPLIYRLLLKIPGTNFFGNCSSGIFWAVVVPAFLFLEFFLTMILLLAFSFPINIVVAATIPTAVLLMFARISLERFINSWNLTIGEKSWNIDRTMPEYLDLLKKKKEKE
jgi:hypothetical protein